MSKTTSFSLYTGITKASFQFNFLFGEFSIANSLKKVVKSSCPSICLLSNHNTK
ncbi:MAG: hypothetical protein LBC61_04515 [Candidatus Peribacteria bacterium]|nr:hypothetical protein [Candidatus Peribacteria bacterium]